MAENYLLCLNIVRSSDSDISNQETQLLQHLYSSLPGNIRLLSNPEVRRNRTLPPHRLWHVELKTSLDPDSIFSLPLQTSDLEIQIESLCSVHYTEVLLPPEPETMSLEEGYV